MSFNFYVDTVKSLQYPHYASLDDGGEQVHPGIVIVVLLGYACG